MSEKLYKLKEKYHELFICPDLDPKTLLEWNEMYGIGQNALEEAKKFKKGDYIVQTHVDYPMESFKDNYCYKQREDCDYLRPELDINGYSPNGCSLIKINETSRWRYATKEEGERYEREGKPFGVNSKEEEVIKVPENINIEFYEHFTTISNNGYSLYADVDGSGYFVGGSTLSFIKPAKLIPCKREEVKKGDVALCSNNKKPDFSYLARYKVILNDTDYVCWLGRGTKPSSKKWQYWYKVVPLED